MIVFGVCALIFGARTLARLSVPHEKVRILEIAQLSDIMVEQERSQTMPNSTLPPPALKKIIRFTPPMVSLDKNVTKADEIKTQEQLNEATLKSDMDTTGTINGVGVKNGIAMGEGAGNPFLIVEQMPGFPGGEIALRNYLARNIRYPLEAQAKRITGTIIISFVVGIDGGISKIQIERGFDKSCEDEAIRVFSQMPKWNAGKQRGKPVYVRFTMPLRFSL